MKRLKIFTWHVHGSYLYYLSQVPADFYVPFQKQAEEGYAKLGNNFPWGGNVHKIPVEKVKDLGFDCIIFQSKKNYIYDQYKILSEKQRTLPKIYIEHDPPREHPTDTKHPVAGEDVLLVHVTYFNELMWDNGTTPTAVIEHGVISPKEFLYTGNKQKGIVMINNIKSRGRRLGYDIFEKVRCQIPLDLIGMGSEEVGGLGEIAHNMLPSFLAQYRFFFNPIRYTSLGLSIIEAMTVGLPIVGLATTELSTLIENDKEGYTSIKIDFLVEKMHLLLLNKGKAELLGKNARDKATKRFSIKRFVKDWEEIILTAMPKQKTNSNHPISPAIGGIV